MTSADLSALYMLRIFQGIVGLYFLLFALTWVELTIKSRKRDIRMRGYPDDWAFCWKYYWGGQRDHAIGSFMVLVWLIILDLAYF